MPAFFGLSIEVYFILFIIGVASFFFWRWVFKRYIRNEGTRKTLTWVVTLFTTPIIYTGLIMIFFLGLTHEPSVEFDQSKWAGDRLKRYQMAADLIDSRLLIGKDTTQVKLILGIPASNQKNTQWVYTMGMGGGGLGFMFHNLVIRFTDSKVTSVEHEKIRD